MNYAKSSLYLVLFMVAWTFLQVLDLSRSVSDSFSPDASTAGGLPAPSSRKTSKVHHNFKTIELQENGFSQDAMEDGDPGSMHLNDYDPVDPVPNYETSIKPGPIEHGSPVIPYIPKPSPPPPDHSKVCGVS